MLYFVDGIFMYIIIAQHIITIIIYNNLSENGKIMDFIINTEF